MTYRGCLSGIIALVKSMFVRGMGIRDIGAVLSMTITKVLNLLTSTKYRINPKQKHYDRLETDECWTYEGNKEHRMAYLRVASGGGVWVGETRPENSTKVEETDKRAGDKL
jgi:serine kinase of HPr protein (carbohydrate metabolism regulator)